MPNLDRLPSWQLSELVHTLAAHYDLDTVRQIAVALTAADRPVPLELHAEQVQYELGCVATNFRNAFHAHADWTLNEPELTRG